MMIWSSSECTLTRKIHDGECRDAHQVSSIKPAPGAVFRYDGRRRAQFSATGMVSKKVRNSCLARHFFRISTKTKARAARLCMRTQCTRPDRARSMSERESPTASRCLKNGIFFGEPPAGVHLCAAPFFSAVYWLCHCACGSVHSFAFYPSCSSSAVLQDHVRVSDPIHCARLPIRDTRKKQVCPRRIARLTVPVPRPKLLLLAVPPSPLTAAQWKMSPCHAWQ